MNTDDVLKKYGAKIEGQMKTTNVGSANYSNEYVKFKKELAPDLNRFERWCRSLGNIIRLKVAKKDEARIKKYLEIAHLDLEPWQALGLSIMVFIAVFLIGLLGSVAYALIKGSKESDILSGAIGNFPFLFFVLMIIFSLFLFYFVNNYPQRLASKWRLKASSQMVPAILYIVVYMRHTSNLEKAIAFASENLEYPLSLDFKKVFYNVEIGKFPTIKESLDNYLETWRDYSPEFIESFHLIESSLFEPDNSRRIVTLEKSIQVVLDGVYNKMLKFTHDVRSPLVNVYMLTVVLPVLGIALLPLASAMVGGMIQWHHVFILYTLILPFLSYYLTDKILLLRPGGYGETGLLEKNPYYSKYKSNKSCVNALIICLPFFVIGFLPLIFHSVIFLNITGLQPDYTFSQIGVGFLGENNYVFDYKENIEGAPTITTASQLARIKNDPSIDSVGPFGFGALILGMFIPLGIALFFSIVFKSKTKELILERKKTKELEREFNNSLFQLGNRMGNGMPSELVFGRVAESSKGLKTQDFFRRVNYNIQQMGMSVEKAIFDSRRGAIVYYPSDLIATSMKVLIESSKKGLKIAAVSLMNISEYVKNIQKITDRLRDLLAEVVSDMKSNMTFLAPLLSGIVIGLAGMIAFILNKFNVGDLNDAQGLGSLSNFFGPDGLFSILSTIPPYYLQIAIGIYLIEIIFILTSTLVSVDSGEDKLEKTNKWGINLKRGVLLYFITAFVTTVALFFLSSIVLGNF